jgi:hypothetical protein
VSSERAGAAILKDCDKKLLLVYQSQEPEGRSQKDRSKKTEVRSQKSGVRIEDAFRFNVHAYPLSFLPLFFPAASLLSLPASSF